MTIALKRYQTAREVRRRVRRLFPAAFPPRGKPPQPLAINIHQPLELALTDEFNPGQIGCFLWRYTNRPHYHRAVQAGGRRVNLDGTPAELIAPEHREHAADMLLLAGFAAAELVAA